MSINHSSLHFTILNQIIKTGYAPNLKNLSTLLNTTEAEVEKALYALQDYHGVVLHPNEAKIWAIHPFSLAPTNFLVTSSRGKWWGNCAWCSLGIAALLKEDVTIMTSFGAHGESVTVHIENGEIREKELLIHFPIPMQKAWDNVIYTCSTMLLFRTRDEIEDWSKRHDIPIGDVQSIGTFWEFSKKWYGNHLNPNWTKWTMEEAKQLFKEFNLNNRIWELEESETRF